MKKILFIVQLPPPVHGASLINSYIVDNKKIKDNFSCKVLPLQFADAIADIGKFSLKKLLMLPVFAIKLLWTLFTFRPTLVYYNLAPSGIAFYRDALYAGMIKISGSKLAFHIQGQGIAENSSKRKWKQWLYKQVFKNSFPICLAERLYADIRSVHMGKHYILNCAIPVQDDLPPKQINTYPVFIFLSNLYKSKGILTFLDSMKILKQRGVHFKAMVVGNNGDFTIDAANAFINTNDLSGNINVIGPLYGKKKFEALCNADYFIFPTVREAFPLTILEAMQCGLVTVSTFTGAIPDMIEDGVNGKLCNSNDPADWASLLEEMVENPQTTKRMGEKAQEEFHKKYTLETFDNNLFTIIQDILNKQ